MRGKSAAPAMPVGNIKLRVVTECSGLEPLPCVLDRLGLSGRYLMVAACEIDPVCRRVIRLRHRGPARPQKMFKDISRRDGWKQRLALGTAPDTLLP